MQATCSRAAAVLCCSDSDMTQIVPDAQAAVSQAAAWSPASAGAPTATFHAASISFSKGTWAECSTSAGDVSSLGDLSLLSPAGIAQSFGKAFAPEMLDTEEGECTMFSSSASEASDDSHSLPSTSAAVIIASSTAHREQRPVSGREGEAQATSCDSTRRTGMCNELGSDHSYSDAFCSGTEPEPGDISMHAQHYQNAQRLELPPRGLSAKLGADWLYGPGVTLDLPTAEAGSTAETGTEAGLFGCLDEEDAQHDELRAPPEASVLLGHQLGAGATDVEAEHAQHRQASGRTWQSMTEGAQHGTDAHSPAAVERVASQSAAARKPLQLRADTQDRVSHSTQPGFNAAASEASTPAQLQATRNSESEQSSSLAALLGVDLSALSLHELDQLYQQAIARRLAMEGGTGDGADRSTGGGIDGRQNGQPVAGSTAIPLQDGGGCTAAAAPEPCRSATASPVAAGEVKVLDHLQGLWDTVVQQVSVLQGSASGMAASLSKSAGGASTPKRSTACEAARSVTGAVPLAGSGLARRQPQAMRQSSSGHDDEGDNQLHAAWHNPMLLTTDSVALSSSSTDDAATSSTPAVHVAASVYEAPPTGALPDEPQAVTTVSQGVQTGSSRNSGSGSANGSSNGGKGSALFDQLESELRHVTACLHASEAKGSASLSSPRRSRTSMDDLLAGVHVVAAAGQRAASRLSATSVAQASAVDTVSAPLAVAAAPAAVACQADTAAAAASALAQQPPVAGASYLPAQAAALPAAATITPARASSRRRPSSSSRGGVQSAAPSPGPSLLDSLTTSGMFSPMERLALELQVEGQVAAASPSAAAIAASKRLTARSRSGSGAGTRAYEHGDGTGMQQTTAVPAAYDARPLPNASVGGGHRSLTGPGAVGAGYLKAVERTQHPGGELGQLGQPHDQRQKEQEQQQGKPRSLLSKLDSAAMDAGVDQEGSSGNADHGAASAMLHAGHAREHPQTNQLLGTHIRRTTGGRAPHPQQQRAMPANALHRRSGPDPACPLQAGSATTAVAEALGYASPRVKAASAAPLSTAVSAVQAHLNSAAVAVKHVHADNRPQHPESSVSHGHGGLLAAVVPGNACQHPSVAADQQQASPLPIHRNSKQHGKQRALGQASPLQQLRGLAESYLRGTRRTAAAAATEAGDATVMASTVLQDMAATAAQRNASSMVSVVLTDGDCLGASCVSTLELRLTTSCCMCPPSQVVEQQQGSQARHISLQRQLAGPAQAVQAQGINLTRMWAPSPGRGSTLTHSTAPTHAYAAFRPSDASTVIALRHGGPVPTASPSRPVARILSALCSPSQISSRSSHAANASKVHTTHHSSYAPLEASPVVPFSPGSSVRPRQGLGPVALVSPTFIGGVRPSSSMSSLVTDSPASTLRYPHIQAGSLVTESALSMLHRSCAPNGTLALALDFQSQLQ